MLSYLARRSLVLTSRGYHIARTMTVAVRVKPHQLSKYAPVRQVKPVSASCFRFASDSAATSGKKFSICGIGSYTLFICDIHLVVL